MKRIGILTSGGDAPGMNAAIRSAVRTALDLGIEIYAIHDGYQGMVDGGDCIQKMEWGSVGGILHQGGTVIGTARCEEFETKKGRRKAAKNLVDHGITGLIVIGGDGSLLGASIFHEEWSENLRFLKKKGQLASEDISSYPGLTIVGLPGSIDNDIHGSDMTIGADTALHRITEAIDAITSTAASHQRSFVVEVMGRNCGYLAMMGALSAGADWVFVPEKPPDPEGWKDEMCRSLEEGRKAGRRDSIVVLAEGAIDSEGNPITSQEVKETLEERIGEETRITILGHVQRGGAPSAFDRNLGTILGHYAVEKLLELEPDGKPELIGMRGNRVQATPLLECVEKTREANDLVKAKDYQKATELRGGSFNSAYNIMQTLFQSHPEPEETPGKPLRIAVMHSGGPAPGMNTSVRAAVRWGKNKGHVMLGVHNGFPGLIKGEIKELGWMDVGGLVNQGGAELGTNRTLPSSGDYYAIARNLEKEELDGLLIIGGEAAYDGAYEMFRRQREFPNFNIPIVCLPATIDNDRPGSELSIGADTALNSIIEAVDKIKQSAVASRRCFVVETMGGYCGYLTLMGGMATGAERVYLHEEGTTLQDLQDDVDHLVTGFKQGKRLGLMIRNENAHEVYTTDFMVRLFEAEGKDLFDVRQAILGHLQQGGNPTPFDRTQAALLAVRCVDFIIKEAKSEDPRSVFMGRVGGEIHFTGMEDYPRSEDRDFGRPKEQWWMGLRPIAKILAQPGPQHVDKAEYKS
ncbi:MAG: 6-phosphofructokinase [Anaerolineales bacterium]